MNFETSCRFNPKLKFIQFNPQVNTLLLITLTPINYTPEKEYLIWSVVIRYGFVNRIERSRFESTISIEIRRCFTRFSTKPSVFNRFCLKQYCVWVKL